MAGYKFNADEWEAACKKFEKNKAGMNFVADFDIVDGKMKITVKQIDEKYKQFLPVMKKLMLETAQGAVAFMVQEFSPAYAFSEDAGEEQQKCSMYVSLKTKEFLHVLFERGYDSFLRLVGNRVSIRQAEYLLAHLDYADETWFLSNGDVWTGEGWKTPEGEVYYNFFSEICAKLIA